MSTAGSKNRSDDQAYPSAPALGYVAPGERLSFSGVAETGSGVQQPHPRLASHQASEGHNTRSPTADDALIGSRIKAQRHNAGLTLQALAKRIGVTGAQFHRYEQGTTRVASSRLMAIAATLQIQPEWLLRQNTPLPIEAPVVPARSSGTDDLVELVEIFASITKPRHRSALLLLARRLASEERGDAAE